MANIIMDILFYATAYVTLFASIFWFTTFFTAAKKRSAKAVHPPLSIIVPAYNEQNNIEKCLTALENQKYPKLKIIVVDDGSTDGTGSVVKRLMKKYKNISYLRKANSGKAASLNYGLKYVGTELFGFIDADTFLSGNALLNMAGLIHGRTASAIAALKPYEPKTRIERLQRIEYALSSFTKKLLSFIGALYFTPGFAIYKTAIIKRLGGFDEKNITEDLEIGLRLKNNGYRIEHALEDSAQTVVPKSFRELFKQRLRWYRGYIYNSRKYSYMFFNKRFADFGVFILPLQYLVLALVIPFLLVSIYDGIIYASQRIIDLFIVNFDLNYLLSASQINIITPTTFFLIIALVAFFFMIRLSNKSAKEKISKLDYLVYIITYPFINLFLWVAAFTYEMVRAKRKW
ncbi:MAG: glycosyltransferase family 2 protein [Candidatus Aenigmarchaeota archaeon]|nr:glycosyltransferase family 2 protein [Candidatus Aenigmarchaeota archaeon]